jgi:hypothetical protein
MKNRECKIQYTILVVGFILIVFGFQYGLSQDLRWLHVSQYQAWIVDYGAENEYTPISSNNFAWPAQYGDNQFTERSRSLWIGAKNFYDPVQKQIKPIKVIGSGPRYDISNQPQMVFSQSIKLVARSFPPVVVVDGGLASGNLQYDKYDEVDPSIPCDRMVVITFNTSMGISVTKKVMAFTQQNHDSYYMYDYVFKNTGIYNAAGDTLSQTLDSLWFHFAYRNSFSGVTSSGYGSTWGAFESEWGASSLYGDFGPYSSTRSTSDTLRGFYSFYSPAKSRLTSGLAYYDEDWGCPNQNGGGVGLNGLLGSAKYQGAVTLFASTSPQKYMVDDINQPATTAYCNTDNIEEQSTVSQYDDVFMKLRWNIMTAGHLDKSMEQAVGTDGQFNSDYYTAHQSGLYGGAQGQGFGPYTLAPGDSIHIVYAEGVNGISWQTCRDVGAVWYAYFNHSKDSTSVLPPLVFPAGVTPPANPTFTDYTKAWVMSGKDSIMQMFRNARSNYRAQYNIPKPPDPPSSFTVTSGGDKIQLTWIPPGSSPTPVAGYVIYRSESNVKTYLTVYQKMAELDAGTTQWSDTSAKRGFNYFYYIQSKDDGSRNDVHPGVPLASSLFYTMTSKPANLLRPAGNLLAEVRVVPNPYDIRARKWQFADFATGLTGGIDQMEFYGIPPKCKLKIYTESGTLIREINHTNGAGDEAWNLQTSSGQIVVSGVYILYVEVTENYTATEDKIASHDITDEHLKILYHKGDPVYSKGQKIFSAGQSTFRKFVVIR